MFNEAFKELTCGVYNILGNNLPAVSAICMTTAGLWAGRKVCLGLGYKSGSLIAQTLDKPIASEWKKISQEYFREANKTKETDFPIIGLVAAGVIIGHIGNVISNRQNSVLLQRNIRSINENHNNQIENIFKVFTAIVFLFGISTGVHAHDLYVYLKK